MAESEPIERKIMSLLWMGKVPVLFTLAPKEVTNLDTPLPLCVMLPRLTYLPLVATEVRRHFESSAPPLEDELWFSHGGVPLKWNIPVGALVDVLQTSTKEPLPLHITVHFQSFPTDKLMRCKSVFTVRSHFFNALKESLFLEYASSQAVMGVSQSDFSALWDSIASPDKTSFDRFSGARSKIMSVVSAASGRSMDECERLPVRLLVSGPGLGSQLTFTIIQQPTPRLTDDSKPQTLRTLFESMLPGVVVDPISGLQKPEVEVLVQGTKPPLTTPLRWLCSYFVHPDFWLYVVVIVHSASS
eukprot:gb/GEZN01012962.1/.p1 GENE.gb/GEZN01012962.1/~~gb/GEZN01012962.1/.p1  ORF type:complete len:301 (+),score=30.46 gb/GEZN01012962.1/:26-928(+)